MPLLFKWLTWFFCLLSFKQAWPQSVDKHLNLGEGIVTVIEYGFPPPPARPAAENLEPRAILEFTSNISFTYYIKKTKVLLKAQDSAGQETGSSWKGIKSDNDKIDAGSLSIRFVHATYLIDCIKRTTYFADSMGQVVEKRLDETRTEPFYRSVNSIPSNQPTIVSIADSGEAIIAGKKCFKGLARDCDGKIFSFYYSKEPIGVRSPLNSLLPTAFAYNILRYDFPVKWSMMDGTVSNEGLLIFQVSSIEPCVIPDNIFIPPKNSLPIN